MEEEFEIVKFGIVKVGMGPLLHMSGTKALACPMSPAGPLEPHLALPNCVLVGGLYGVQLPAPHSIDFLKAVLI